MKRGWRVPEAMATRGKMVNPMGAAVATRKRRTRAHMPPPRTVFDSEYKNVVHRVATARQLAHLSATGALESGGCDPSQRVHAYAFAAVGHHALNITHQQDIM